MNTNPGELRVHVDERWTAEDMVTLMREMMFLYDLRLCLDFQQEEIRYWEDWFPPFLPPRRARTHVFRVLAGGPLLYQPAELREFTHLHFPSHDLTIPRIRFESPGNIDLSGIASVLKSVVTFLASVTTVDLLREKRRLENKTIELQLARDYVKFEVEQARANLEIAELEGLAAIALQHAKPIQRLVEENKIQRIEYRPNADSREA